MKLTMVTLSAGTATLVAAADQRRGYLEVINVGANPASLGFDSTVTAGNGWPLYANGPSLPFRLPAFAPLGTVYAISTLGTTIAVLEG